MTTEPTGLSIAQAAERSRLSADTLRYYEKDGLLLQPVTRSSSGHRRYSAADLDWIEMLTRLRATGMPIREIHRYVEMVRRDDGNEGARQELLVQHRSRVLDQLAEVSRHLEAIDHKIAYYAERLAPAA